MNFGGSQGYWRFKNQQIDLGKFGESLWSRLVLSCGMFYVPLKDLPAINGKGPRLQGSDTILPDFDISGKRRAYLDSKCKSHPVLFAKAGELRHGIDGKDVESYSAISGVNRQKCLIGVIELFRVDEHEWSGSLLMESLGKLGDPIRGFSTQRHMVYWPRSRFIEVHQLPPDEMLRIASGGEVWDAELRRAVAEMFCKPEPPIQARFF